MDLSHLIIQTQCAHVHVWGKEVLVLNICLQELKSYIQLISPELLQLKEILQQNDRKHETGPYAIAAEYRFIIAGVLRDACITRQGERRARYYTVQRVNIDTA